MIKAKNIERIISYLANESGFITSKKLSDELGLSQKTVYRLIKEINQDYVKESLILSEKGKGFRLNGDVYLKHQHRRHLLDEELSPKERQKQILERLLLSSPQSQLIYDLCRDYFISEHVIQKDKTEIQKILKNYHLSIISKSRALYIDGNEFDLRRAIADLVTTFKTIDMDHLSYLKDDYAINYQVALFVSKQLKIIENNLEVTIPYPYNVNIFSHLYILLDRIQKVKPESYSEKDLLRHCSNQAVLAESRRVIADIEKYSNRKVSRKEIVYLYQYLVSSCFQTQSDSKPDFSKRVIEVTHYYFKHMGMTEQGEIKEDSLLFIDLANHIAPMLRRLDNKIRIKNKMLGQIQTSYAAVFNQLVKVSDNVSQKYGFPKINPDEVGFMTLYFVRFKEIQYEPIPTLIVCTSGIGTSELLRSKIERTFSDLKVEDVISYDDLYRLKDNYPEVELLITSIAIEDDFGIDSVLVSAIMTEDDKHRINQQIERMKYGR